MADLLMLLRTFVRCADRGSFTAVAEELGTTQPTVSRQIASLEEHLGCRLFQRSTRALAPTDDGRLLYPRAVAAIEAAAEAEGAVGRRRGAPSGRLRLACAGVFGRLHVVPRLPRFRARFPEVEIDLRFADGFVDLVEAGIDLAIRVGEVTDEGLIARRIGTSRRIVVATPDLIARVGRPEGPDDLRALPCIVYDRLAAGAAWTFDGPDGPVSVPVDGPVHCDATEAVRAAALAGLGFAYVPAWHFPGEAVRDGRLVEVLRDRTPPPLPISATYPSRRNLAAKTRAMIDFLAEEFHVDPLLSGALG